MKENLSHVVRLRVDAVASQAARLNGGDMCMLWYERRTAAGAGGGLAIATAATAAAADGAGAASWRCGWLTSVRSANRGNQQ